MYEENTSHRTTDGNDGEREKPPTPPASLQGEQEPAEESLERVEEQEYPNEATRAMGIFSPANSQDNVMEAKLHSLD